MTALAFRGLRREAKWMATTTPGRIFLLTCLMYFLTYVDRVNISVLAPMMKTDLHMSNIQLGFVLSAFGYPYALLQLFGGGAADLFGARRTLFVCGLVWAVATIATGLVGGMLTLIVVRVLLGAGEGPAFPTATRAMASWMPASRRGYAQGVTHAFSRFANAVTPPIVIAIAFYLGWRGAFVILGCVSSLWVVAWFFYYRDEPATHAGITAEDLAVLPPPLVQKTDRKLPWGPLLSGMATTALIYFCYNWTFWVFITWLPSYFVQAYGMNLMHMAAFSCAVYGAGVVGDAAGGMITDAIARRTGDVAKSRRVVIVVSFLGAMVSLLPVLLTHSIVAAGFSLASTFFFLELTIGPIWAVPMDIAPNYSGSASGIMMLGSGIASIISPFVFGLLIDLTHSYIVPFYGSILLLLAGALLTHFFLPSEPLDLDDTKRERPERLVPADASQAARTVA